jgi:hypothetical protein
MRKCKQLKQWSCCGLVVVLCLFWFISAVAIDKAPDDQRTFRHQFEALNKTTVGVPNVLNRSHKVGNVWMTITNYGTFGANFMDQWDEMLEPDGTPAPSFEFPAGSGSNYLYAGALWFGAVVGIDTLVTVGSDGWMRIHEMYPEHVPNGEIIQFSTRKSSEFYSDEAVSEQDYIAEYTDSLTSTSYIDPDPYDARPHMPLGIKVRQKSYSWSYKYAQDFILLDFTIFNISENLLESSYMALYVDADCWNRAMSFADEGFKDDYSGYKLTVPSNYPGLQDTINIAWTADNDGDPFGGSFDFRSNIAVSGTRVVRGPLEADRCGPAPLNYSFNWWTSESNTNFDWGPRDRRRYRNFGTGGEGTPAGDPNKYYIMSNREFDYDQLFAAIDYSDETNWMAPTNTALATNIADGFDTRYLFSFGPLKDLYPGDSVSVTIGYIGGDNFHVAADDFDRFFNAQKPSLFYDRLDFTDFGVNAQWAAWVYDNPGVDTPDPFTGETDGCKGLFYLVDCLDTLIIDGDTVLSSCDSAYYAGDGIPDFKGPPPPPPPEFELLAEPGIITIQWTGELSELTPDDFTNKQDFEGYRLYMGELNTLNSMTLISSWDQVNFRRLEYNRSTNRFKQRLDPFSTEQLKEMYGDDFDPLEYDTPQDTYVDDRGAAEGSPDTVFYLLPQDNNLDNKYVLTNGDTVLNVIQQVGTETVLVDSVNEIYMEYGVYEASIGNLLPSRAMYFAVSAFDFGNPITNLEPLESSPIANTQLAYPAYTAQVVEEKGLSVSVYPNPYKISADYRGRGYEDPLRQGWSERERRIHFVNLPTEATIRIYSIDGDLVREINHPDPHLSDSDSHLAWDLVSRNIQAVVSGIYIYAIESKLGTQIGKIVIIK